MAIPDWPAAERPRERLLQLGAAALSEAELLAIFLRTGVKGRPAVDLARELLQHFQGLRGLMAATQEQFCACRGLGTAKFVQLQASLEMSRRFLLEGLRHGDALESPTAVRQYLQGWIRGRLQEVFVCLFLDTRHRVLRDEILFRGTIDSTAIYPREVVRRALELNAAALIVAHNHPSGVAEPSRADIDLTARLKQALALVDVRLLDHLIIGDQDVLSLAERGLV